MFLSVISCSANSHVLWYQSVFVKHIPANNISPLIYQSGSDFGFKSYYLWFLTNKGNLISFMEMEKPKPHNWVLLAEGYTHLSKVV